MRWMLPCAIAAVIYTLPMGVPAAHATSPVPVSFGASWDGPSNELQRVVDAYIGGAPGQVNVHTDFVGAHPADLDPWFWVDSSFPALMVTEIAGNRNTNELGWYKETFTRPVIDGVDDGVVFTGAEGGGSSAIITLPSAMSKFGFYLNTHLQVSTPAGTRTQVFFTNRFYNDPGPFGNGAIHAPFDGDVQALVFDVSQWKGPKHWLVCFEDLDSGLPVQPCCTGTDDDYNDLVFEVTAFGATPTQTLTFGALKAKYR